MVKHVLILVGAIGLVLTACHKAPPADSARATPSPGVPEKILRIGNGAEPVDIDPQVVSGQIEHHIVTALFESLVAEDPRDLHPVPGQAERWELSADGLVYTFHLRPNLTWSNGEPLTADDFVQSYRRMLSPNLAAEYAYHLWFVTGAQEFNQGKLADFSAVGFKAPNPTTLVVTLKSPTPFLLNIIASHYSWMPVPVREITKYGAIDDRHTGWTRPEHLVSNGPFRLKAWSPNQKIGVERNPLYWDAANVKLDGIEFFPVDDVAAEERMFRTGQIHKTQEVPVAKIDTYRRDFPAALRIDPFLGVGYYLFNVTRPPFTDARVRRALTLAIDRESIVKNVLRGGQQPAYALSYPGTAGYAPRARLEGGIAEAKQLLAAAGFPDGRGFPETELLYNTSENNRILAEAVQQMWRDNLGITVNLVNQEWKVYVDAMRTHNFSLGRRGWLADYIDPNVFLEIWTTGNGNNDGAYSNPAFDRLMGEALTAANEHTRYECYQQMDAILMEDCPVLPIFYYTRVYALSPKVLGWYPTLLDNHPYKYVDLAE